jgi:hypothetical protein
VHTIPTAQSTHERGEKRRAAHLARLASFLPNMTALHLCPALPNLGPIVVGRAGEEVCFGRAELPLSDLRTRNLSSQISRKQALLKRTPNGALQVACHGSGMMRLVRQGASTALKKGQDHELLLDDLVQCLAVERRCGCPMQHSCSCPGGQGENVRNATVVAEWHVKPLLLEGVNPSAAATLPPSVLACTTLPQTAVNAAAVTSDLHHCRGDGPGPCQRLRGSLSGASDAPAAERPFVSDPSSKALPWPATLPNGGSSAAAHAKFIEAGAPQRRAHIELGTRIRKPHEPASNASLATNESLDRLATAQRVLAELRELLPPSLGEDVWIRVRVLIECSLPSSHTPCGHSN